MSKNANEPAPITMHRIQIRRAVPSRRAGMVAAMSRRIASRWSKRAMLGARLIRGSLPESRAATGLTFEWVDHSSGVLLLHGTDVADELVGFLHRDLRPVG